MPNLKDVARLAGVSIATASNVLRGTKAASAEVERRVRSAAEAVGYVPHRQARSLRTGRSHTIGVALPDLTNPFFPALVQAIEAAGRAAGYALLLGDANGEEEGEREAIELLAAYRVDGLIWVPVGDTRPPGIPAGLPIVSVDRPLPGCDGVRSDHAAGGRLIAEHLEAMGYGRFGLLSGPTRLPSASERRRGFLEALSASAEVVWEVEVPFHHELPAEARSALTAGGVDAVVCASDVIAVGALRTLQESGRRVPDELAVVGFDDIAWAELVSPPLTTVRQPLAELGAEAFRLLLDRLEAPDAPPRSSVLPVELVVRASSGALQGSPA